MTSTARSFESPSYAVATPRLSVAIPFFRYDPLPLFRTLCHEAKALDLRVEILLLDDGSDDPPGLARLADAVQESEAPARLLAFSANQGRSAGRNWLFAESRARHLLFLDCDMAPDAEDFLETWLRHAQAHDPACTFGGFSLKQTEISPATRLHAAIQQRGECVDAAHRAQAPAKYVYASNLLVRRDVFAAAPFDAQFQGWGWEDVEWGVRIAKQYPISHIDNPASHLGLDGDAALFGKYLQGGANFARLVQLHPDAVAAYPSVRLARRLKFIPAKAALMKGLRAVAQSPSPTSARVFAAKLYRTLIYAEALARSSVRQFLIESDGR